MKVFRFAYEYTNKLFSIGAKDLLYGLFRNLIKINRYLWVTISIFKSSNFFNFFGRALNNWNVDRFLF